MGGGGAVEVELPNVNDGVFGASVAGVGVEVDPPKVNEGVAFVSSGFLSAGIPNVKGLGVSALLLLPNMAPAVGVGAAGVELPKVKPDEALLVSFAGIPNPPKAGAGVLAALLAPLVAVLFPNIPLPLDTDVELPNELLPNIPPELPFVGAGDGASPPKGLGLGFGCSCCCPNPNPPVFPFPKPVGVEGADGVPNPNPGCAAGGGVPLVPDPPNAFVPMPANTFGRLDACDVRPGVAPPLPRFFNGAIL